MNRRYFHVGRGRGLWAAVWVLGVLAHGTSAFAQRGAMFVSNNVAQNVSVYARTASGSPPPAAVITNGLAGPHEVTVYSTATTKELVVANNAGNTITFYDANVASPTFGQLTR